MSFGPQSASASSPASTNDPNQSTSNEKVRPQAGRTLPIPPEGKPDDGTSFQPGPNAQAATDWICYTKAYQPVQQQYAGGGQRYILSTMDMSCNVPVMNVWFYQCIQVSNNNSNFWDQGPSVCGWTSHGNGTFKTSQRIWNCSSTTNLWWYRTRGYSQKTWPDGSTTNSPWKTSSSLAAFC